MTWKLLLICLIDLSEPKSDVRRVGGEVGCRREHAPEGVTGERNFRRTTGRGNPAVVLVPVASERINVGGMGANVLALLCSNPFEDGPDHVFIWYKLT